jgi:hypothetical protein
MSEHRIELDGYEWPHYNRGTCQIHGERMVFQSDIVRTGPKPWNWKERGKWLIDVNECVCGSAASGECSACGY